MTYKSVRPGLQNVSCLNGRIFQVFATINMQKEIPFITSSKRGGRDSEKSFKKISGQADRLACDDFPDRCDRAGGGCHVCDIRAVVGLRPGIA